MNEWVNISSKKHDNIEDHSGKLIETFSILSIKRSYHLQTSSGDKIPLKFNEQLKPFLNQNVDIEGYFDKDCKKFIVLRIRKTQILKIKREIIHKKLKSEIDDEELQSPQADETFDSSFDLEYRTKKPSLTGTLDGDKDLIISGKSMDTSCAYNKDL